MGEIIQRLLETFTGPVLYLIIFGALLAESTVILGFWRPVLARWCLAHLWPAPDTCLQA